MVRWGDDLCPVDLGIYELIYEPCASIEGEVRENTGMPMSNVLITLIRNR